MSPGEIYELEIVMYPTSTAFDAGPPDRVDISSSNFPRFDINPNTGGTLGRDRRVVPAENVIYHDPDHPLILSFQLFRSPGRKMDNDSGISYRDRRSGRTIAEPLSYAFFQRVFHASFVLGSSTCC